MLTKRRLRSNNEGLRGNFRIILCHRVVLIRSSQFHIQILKSFNREIAILNKDCKLFTRQLDIKDEIISEAPSAQTDLTFRKK